jgi:hypothetical protein
MIAPHAQAATGEEGVFGVNVGLELRYQQNEEETAIDKINSLNIKWVREEFNWNVIEPSEGVYDWNGFGRIMGQYDQAGINVLGVLAYSADWASTAPDDITTNRDKYAPQTEAWASFVTAVVSRYPEIKYWEVWNEPNHSAFLIADDPVTEYKNILQTASQAIRSANTSAKVVTGGLSGSDSDFIRRLYWSGANEYFDIIAIHPYRSNNGLGIYAPEEKQFGLNSLVNDIYVMRSMIRAYDPTPAPIWITELGWSTYTGGVSEAAQANYLQRSFLQSRMYPQVEKIFWYNLRDDEEADSQDKNFGLFDYNWREKQSARGLRQLATSYPSLAVQEDSELFDKPIEEFLNPERISVESYDNGKLTGKQSVARRPDIKAVRGKGSVGFHYEFANNDAAQYRKIIIQGIPYSWYDTFDLWLWSDGGIQPVRFRMKDSTGEIFQVNVGYTGYGWTRLNLSLKDIENNFVSWGGNADKKVDFPATLDSIIIEKNPESPIFSGDIVLSRFTYRRLSQAYSLRFQQAGRNIWSFWKQSGLPEVATTYTPLDRPMSMWNLRDTGFRNLLIVDMPVRDVIMFGLEEQPIFIQ